MRKDAIILLVEDDEVDVMTIKRSFKQNNVTNQLFIVSHGEEAVEFFRHEGKYAKPESSPRPSLILLDLNLPRMNGLELLSYLKSDSDLKEIPVVVLTSSDEASDIKASFQEGVAGYIVKPLNFEKFAKSMATLDHYWTVSKLP